MINQVHIEENLREALSAGRQLPASCYTDSEVYIAEMEKFYASSWMAIGFASQYREIDRAWPVTALEKPLLITRDSEEVLHVFHNVCRHRGHVLLDDAKVSGKILRCPYHSWCYSLDGRFVTAPFWDGTENSAPSAEQKQSIGLVPVRFTVWYDVIFVNLSGRADSFESYIQPLRERWTEYRPQNLLRCFSHQNFSIEGNWKLAAENFLDNYHLPWVHPEVGSSVSASLGLAVENLTLSENVIGFSHPTAGADKGKTTKPLPSWPTMSSSEAQRQDLFFLFPNTCFVMEGYYLWSMVLQPVSAGHCIEKLALYVLGEKALEDQFMESRSQLRDLIYNINSQDAKVIQNLQKGRQSDAASAGVYTPFHDQLGKQFHQIVIQKLLEQH